MTFDEYMTAHCNDTSHHEKIRPFLDSECEALRAQYLSTDLMGVVYEFLGYTRIKTAQLDTRKGKKKQLATFSKPRRRI